MDVVALAVNILIGLILIVSGYVVFSVFKNPGVRIGEEQLADNTMPSTGLPEKNQQFAIQFTEGREATAVLVAADVDANLVIEKLGLESGRPTLFITGGAGAMSDEDKAMTRQIIEEGIVQFAQENQLTMIDGGTETGVMQMIGTARRKHNYSFPLIGVAPHGRVKYPGYDNPNYDAILEDSHSHFVLVDAPDWGDESETIVQLTWALAGAGKARAMGVLINGGRVSKQDVFLATTKSEHKIPILVLEGSGRFADELATAFRTGKTSQNLIRTIIAGGDIELVSTIEGPDAMRTKLAAGFKTED